MKHNRRFFIKNGKLVRAPLAPDTSKADYTITIFEIIRIVAEVLSPESQKLLRFNARPDHPEDVSIAEFMEEEMIYIEFQRVLVMMAVNKSASLYPEFGYPERVAGYLDWVFFPAFAQNIIFNNIQYFTCRTI